MPFSWRWAYRYQPIELYYTALDVLEVFPLSGSRISSHGFQSTRRHRNRTGSSSYLLK